MTQFPSLQPEGGVFNSSPEAPHDTPSKSRVIKFSIIAVSAVILLFALAVVWEAFFSPRARSDFETRENYEQAVKGMKEFEDRMTSDTYGGKTPQETLDMFIDALEKDDIDLAVKYVYWDGGRKSIDTREAMREGIINAKNNNELSDLIRMLKNAIPAGSSMKGYYGFEVRDDKENLISDIGFVQNRFSGVWKIESM